MTKSERRWLIVLTVMTALAFIPIFILNLLIMEQAIHDGFKETFFGSQNDHYCYDIFEDCCSGSVNIEEIINGLGAEIVSSAAEV